MDKQGLPRDQYPKVKDRIHEDKKNQPRGTDLPWEDIEDIIQDVLRGLK